MSAIAEYLLLCGATVIGSDIRESTQTAKLCELGAKIYIGHKAENVSGASVVVYNSSIKPNNPELAYAKKIGLKIYGRMEFLNEISKRFKVKIGVAGCHGKTTATAMIGAILSANNEKFLMHVGGNVVDIGNLYFSGNDYFLSEICEFDRNIDKFNAEIACLLNVGYDHADCYKDIYEIQDAYLSYIKRAKFGIVNGDDEYSAKTGLPCLTFGLNDECDIYADDVELKNGRPSFTLNIKNDIPIKINLNVYGLHNVYNALAAAAVAIVLNVPKEKIKEGLENFKGIYRRFEFVGKFNGADVICDYAHHPTEISAALKTVNDLGYNNVCVIFQPHTYSRTKALKKEFAESLSVAENLFIYKTFPAREEYDADGSAESLFKELKNAKGFFQCADDVKKRLQQGVGTGDAVLVLGAGDLYDEFKVMLSKDGQGS